MRNDHTRPLSPKMQKAIALFAKNSQTLRETGNPNFITCPDCLISSFNPDDILYGYCGNCHEYHEDMRYGGKGKVNFGKPSGEV